MSFSRFSNTRPLSPADANGVEDESQQALEDGDASPLSDKVPAGYLAESKDSLDSARRGRETSNKKAPRLAKRLDIRMSNRERTLLDNRAHLLGTKTSTLARAILVDFLSQDNEKIDAIVSAGVSRPDPQIAQSIEQLRKLGNNLNQVMRRANIARKNSDGKAEIVIKVNDQSLRKVMNAVNELRASLGDRISI